MSHPPSLNPAPRFWGDTDSPEHGWWDPICLETWPENSMVLYGFMVNLWLITGSILHGYFIILTSLLVWEYLRSPAKNLSFFAGHLRLAMIILSTKRMVHYTVLYPIQFQNNRYCRFHVGELSIPSVPCGEISSIHSVCISYTYIFAYTHFFALFWWYHSEDFLDRMELDRHPRVNQHRCGKSTFCRLLS